MFSLLNNEIMDSDKMVVFAFALCIIGLNKNIGTNINKQKQASG